MMSTTTIYSTIHDTSPTYMARCRSFASLAPTLGRDYEVPCYFSPQHYRTSERDTDLFRLLGDRQRPDYRWVRAVRTLCTLYVQKLPCT